MHIKKWIVFGVLLSLFTTSYANIRVPILVYHYFHPSKKGSMTMSTAQFTAQMQWLANNHYRVIPLKQLVHAILNRSSVAEKSVVITIDDGWETVDRYAVPIIEKFHYPVTLFINPKTIGSKSHLSWAQLSELQSRGFDIEDHTGWHPNFKIEKRRRSQAAFDRFAEEQMVGSKQMLENHLHTKVTMLAWPFGIYDKYLMGKAEQAGYDMAFTIDARKASWNDQAMAVPRYMIIASQSMNEFARIVG